MDIIRKATKIRPKDIVYVKKCRTCGCVFLYKIDDIIANYDGDDLVRCPDCKYFDIIIFRRKYRGKKNVKN